MCKVLGVQLDLRQSGDGLCFITNTDEKIEELTKELDEALRTKTFPGVKGRNSQADFKLPAHTSSAESSGGCLKFCQIMPLKAGRHCLSTLKHAFDILKLLTQNAPRKIEASQAEVLHIYVDASFDNSG